MKFSPRSGEPGNARCGVLVIGVNPKSDTGRWCNETFGSDVGAHVSRAIDAGDLGDGPARTLLVHTPAGANARRILLVSSGDAAISPDGFRRMIEAAAGCLTTIASRDAVWALTDLDVEGWDVYAKARASIAAIAAAAYRFDAPRARPDADAQTRLRRVALLARGDGASLRRAIDHGQAIANGMQLARDLGNLPGNVCTPSYLARRARALVRGVSGASVTVLNEADMRRLGMGAFLSVTAGSTQPARLIVLRYRGGEARTPPLALVGKGITFDTGGISLKPGAAMDEMKFDMCGAASVFGAMQAAMEMGLPINLVGVVAAAENMPDGAASRPGDVVTSLSGQTIEILNTDAEGRLVLCDALTYALRFKPAAMVDIATLTGACVIALGSHAAGLFSNDDGLREELLDAGNATHDRAWPMPLFEEYFSQLKSNFADMANIGGREAGSVTAACFLSRFAEDAKWAHLDVAGVAYKGSGSAKGATGRPVPLLAEWLIRRAGVPR